MPNFLQARPIIQPAQANLFNSRYIAPFDGVVSQVNLCVGSFFQRGQVQIIITDPSYLHVETTDLNEQDIVKGKAFNQSVIGKVTVVSSPADMCGGDVVHKVFIQLDEPPEDALPDMTLLFRFTAN